MKNNFTQALKELTGFDGEPNQAESEKKESAKKESKVETVKKEHVTVTSTVPSVDIEPKVQEDIVTFKAFCDTPSGESTHITPNMVIKGDISSKNNLFVNGDIIGNVQTTANINATKTILGNVTAQSMYMEAARLKGDLEIESELIVGNGSVIVGNVACDQLNVSGKIKGNCDVRKSARMTASAYLVGDICVDDLMTDQGARIQGKVSTRTAAEELDADFDFGGEF